MAGIDSSRPFRPLNLAILTVSDSRTLETDTSGATLKTLAEEAGHVVVDRCVLPDDQEGLVDETSLRRLCMRSVKSTFLALGSSSGGRAMRRLERRPFSLERRRSSPREPTFSLCRALREHAETPGKAS